MTDQADVEPEPEVEQSEPDDEAPEVDPQPDEMAEAEMPPEEVEAETEHQLEQEQPEQEEEFVEQEQYEDQEEQEPEVQQEHQQHEEYQPEDEQQEEMDVSEQQPQEVAEDQAEVEEQVPETPDDARSTPDVVAIESLPRVVPPPVVQTVKAPLFNAPIVPPSFPVIKPRPIGPPVPADDEYLDGPSTPAGPTPKSKGPVPLMSLQVSDSLSCCQQGVLALLMD